MKVIEIDKLPKKIAWAGCLREPIYDAQHNIVGFFDRVKRKAFVKRGFKVNPQELVNQDFSD